MKKKIFLVFLFTLSFSLFQFSLSAAGTLSPACAAKTTDTAKTACDEKEKADTAKQAEAQKAELTSSATELRKKAEEIAVSCSQSGNCSTVQLATINNLIADADYREAKAKGEDVTQLKKNLEVAQTVLGARTSEAAATVAIGNTQDFINRCNIVGCPESQLNTLNATLEKYKAEQAYQGLLANCPDSCSESDQKKLADAKTKIDAANIAYAKTAQNTLATQKMNLCNYGICFSNIKTIEKLAENIIKFLARLIAILAVCAFMLGGFLMIIRVDDEGRAQAKAIMINSIIAVIVVLSAYVIVSFIQQVLYSLGK